MHLLCVLLLLQALLASAQGPTDGCCSLNTTVVAGEAPPIKSSGFEYATSVVDTGSLRMCVCVCGGGVL